MNEEYERLKKQIEHELTKHYKAKLVTNTVINYYGIAKRSVIGNSQLAPVVLVRQMVIHIACNIYGIPLKTMAKYLKYKGPDSVRVAQQSIKEKVINSVSLQNDTDELRKMLAKVINGNHP